MAYLPKLKATIGGGLGGFPDRKNGGLFTVSKIHNDYYSVIGTSGTPIDLSIPKFDPDKTVILFNMASHGTVSPVNWTAELTDISSIGEGIITFTPRDSGVWTDTVFLTLMEIEGAKKISNYMGRSGSWNHGPSVSFVSKDSTFIIPKINTHYKNAYHASPSVHTGDWKEYGRNLQSTYLGVQIMRDLAASGYAISYGASYHFSVIEI